MPEPLSQTRAETSPSSAIFENLHTVFGRLLRYKITAHKAPGNPFRVVRMLYPVYASVYGPFVDHYPPKNTQERGGLLSTFEQERSPSR